MVRWAAATVSLALLAIQARAEEPSPAVLERTATKPVIELFTSQGCSSCPPADELLARLAKRDDIIALSFNVDYWDYLGWKDTLASPANTKRQYAYARARGDGKVYTPQVIVDGMRHVVGSRPDKIETALTATEKRRLRQRVTLALSATKTGLTIDLDGKVPPKMKSATVLIAAVQPTVKVKIKRGENDGRRITYHNVVRKLVPVATWSGGPKHIAVNRHDIADKAGERYLVLVQADGPGAMLAADWAPDAR